MTASHREIKRNSEAYSKAVYFSYKLAVSITELHSTLPRGPTATECLQKWHGIVPLSSSRNLVLLAWLCCSYHGVAQKQQNASGKVYADEQRRGVSCIKVKAWRWKHRLPLTFSKNIPILTNCCTKLHMQNNAYQNEITFCQ